MKQCIQCKFLVLTDEGYSNYSVENTTATCLHSNNPMFPCDSFYGKAPEHEFAEKCELFCEGAPVRLDVDRYEGEPADYTTDPVVKLMLILAEKN